MRSAHLSGARMRLTRLAYQQHSITAANMADRDYRSFRGFGAIRL
jgi:hypothetical protein